MRFYTVPDAKQARKSVFVATGFIGYFYILTFVIGFSAAALVGREAIKGVNASGNMAAILLSEHTGGSLFLGFIAAVAFATILAVVAGLTLSGASSIAHDLYVNVFRKGESNEKGEVKVAKMATIGLGILAIILGLAFKNQNVAFMVGLAFAVAASANFPALLLSVFWKKFTTKGATWSIVVGALSAIILIVFSPPVMKDIMGYEPIFPLKNPALVSVPLAFITGVIVSLIKPEQEAQEKFEKEKIRTYLGVGAE
jgi:cation/acetate symporter